jgi:glycosyltransferase involved in cell wall biosynthesis
MEQNIKNKNMHLVMLGQDASLLSESSEAMERTLAYGEYFSGIHAYVFAKKILQQRVTNKNVSVVGFSTLFQALVGFFRIWKDVKGLKNKGLQVVITTQDPFEIGLIGLIISRFTRTFFHVQIHTDISSVHMQHEGSRTYLQYLLSRLVLPRAHRIRVVSQRLANFCMQKLHIANKKIDRVPMFYTRGIKKASPRFSIKPHIIVLPARFVWFKRIPLALEAFSLALQKNKNIRLQIIGAGPLKQEIERVISELKISEYVEIIPWMKAEELYQNASLTLISSIYEGWCRVAVESVEAGVPVVMTDVGCAHEFIRDSKEGIIAPIEDPQALASAMGQILENEEVYMRFKDECLKTSATIDSFEIYEQKVVESWAATTSQVR